MEAEMICAASAALDGVSVFSSAADAAFNGERARPNPLIY